MKKNIYLYLLFPALITSAQNLDSLYNTFLLVKGIIPATRQLNIQSENEPIKCSFGIINQVKSNYHKFTAPQKTVLGSLLVRPQEDTNFVTPGGKFRIHYKYSGIDAPIYDLNELARAADSSYNYEINILGYPPPPRDFGKSGIRSNPDDLYDIFIQNLAASDYGYAQHDSTLNAFTRTSYIVIDNDFGDGKYTYGIDGARVTLSHELHHAIQMGNYIYRENDFYYYEITSTAMEEFVYPGIDDYISSISAYFRNTQRSFVSTSYDKGYSRAIWNIYLKDRFGIDIIKRIWELIPTERAIKAIADAITEKGSSFKVEFNTFGIWNYFTGVRALAGKYYEEAAKYPMINPTIMANSMTVNSESVSNNLFQLNNYALTNKDSVVTIVTNSDLEGAINSTSKVLPFTYSISTLQISGSKKIAEGFYSKLESSNLLLLTESHLLSGYRLMGEYAYPQPFSYSRHTQLFIPAAGIKGDVSDLSIYSIDMKLVFKGPRSVLTDNVISWDAHDNANKKLSTGVYIYVTMTNDSIKKGKFVLYND